MAALTDRTQGRRTRRLALPLLGAAAAAALAVAAVQLWPGEDDQGVTLPAGATLFDVPTYDRDPGQDGAMALIAGHLTFTDDGCPAMYQPGTPDALRPVLFPNAVGVRLDSGVRLVVEEGTSRVFATEDQPFEYAGGTGGGLDAWTGRCGETTTDGVARVNDRAEGPALEQVADGDGSLGEPSGWHVGVPPARGPGGRPCLVPGRSREAQTRASSAIGS